MSQHARLDAELASLYDHVPQIPACDGRCAMACRQPVEQSNREHQRAPIGADTGEPCQHLGADDRCQVYEQRPMLCRLWGATETLPCPFGCVPDGKRLDPEQEFALFVYSLAVGGGSRVGWPQTFDPEAVMEAFRADAGGVRTRFLAQRARAREDLTSRATLDRSGPGRRRAT